MNGYSFAYVVLSFLLLFLAFCTLYPWTLLIGAISCRKSIPSNPGMVRLLSGEFTLSNPNEPEFDLSHDLPNFLIIVPAHNEELLLGNTLDSLQALSYPVENVSILVIADNCSDSTAEIADSKGVYSAIRSDIQRVGKGYALQDVLSRLFLTDAVLGPTSLNINADLLAKAFDGYIFIDADTIVSGNLLNIFARQIKLGDTAMQGCYSVLNPFDSIRTKLMICALALVHLVKPLGRQRLGLSDGFKGNGMCITGEVLAAVPWAGDSITEDIEYTLRLCESGRRVAFVPDALLWSPMPVNASAAKTQRNRWESGRAQLLIKCVPGLVMKGLKRHSFQLLDRAFELIIPPFAELAAVQLVALIASFVLFSIKPGVMAHLLLLFSLGLLALQCLYVLTGLWLARIPLRISSSLLFAPMYIVWKVGLKVRRLFARTAAEWVRTERNNP